jgi:hypothetical protein
MALVSIRQGDKMTHDELLAKIDQWAKNSLGIGDLTHQQMCYGDNCKCYEYDEQGESLIKALRSVVELHKPFEVNDILLCECEPLVYPCPTIKAIEKELE